MGENSELEEGETNCSADEAIDPDVDLSYIDEKIQNVLGHFQKDFEGWGVSADLLGPKFGAYGSFLPSYQHSSVVPSHRRIPQTNPTAQRYPSSFPRKNAVQDFEPLPTASCKVKSHAQINQDSGSLSIQTSGKVSTKKGNASLSTNDSSDHKPVRVRIKMGSEILSRKVAMVYRGLGLDDSPASSLGNSHDESSRVLLPIPQDVTCESPSSILRDMTSVPVPDGSLMSPLSDSLLSLMRKAKQETLMDNELVDKARKEPSVMSHNKSCDVLGNGNTPKGKKKRLIDSFDATANTESPSFEAIKRQKTFSTGQKVKENSTCGSSDDVPASRDKLPNNINKAGESDQRVTVNKSTKKRVSSGRLKDSVLRRLEKEQKASPSKSKEKFSSNGSGNKMVSETPFKDAACTSRNNMGFGLGFEVTPPSASLELDNWVQCDNCETWRLLPFGMLPEQLPDKWLCSMQSWLPGMNHCGLGEEETADAVKSLFQISGTEVQNLETHVSNLASDAGHVDQSHQPFTLRLLHNQIEKSTVKERSKGGFSNTLFGTENSMKSNLQVPVKMKSLKQPLGKHNATGVSIAHDLGLSCDFDEDKCGPDLKAKRVHGGTASQERIKKKRENDKEGNETSKKMKTDDGNELSRKIKLKDKHWSLNLETMAVERTTKRYGNGSSTGDTEQDKNKRLIASKKKLGHQSQPPSGGVSLSTKGYGRMAVPAKKKRLMEYKANHDGNKTKLYSVGESIGSLHKKDKATRVSTTKCKELKTSQNNGMHPADGLGEHSNFDASYRYFSCGSGQASGIATSSSSKVLGSHKTGRSHVEEIKASPVESVSSSPTRSSCPEKLASAGDSISRKDYNLNCGDAGSRIINKRIPLDLEGDSEIETITRPKNEKKSNPEACSQNSELGALPCTSKNTVSWQNLIPAYPSESKEKPLNSPVSQNNVIMNGAGTKKFCALTHGTIDSSSQVADDVLKDANKLRKLADCFKSHGFTFERKEAIFKAALKFLYGASLLEMCSGKNVQHGEMDQVEAYHTAAKLSESCAYEYETSQEMAAAALAYKCMEVAYMRVVYGRSLSTSRDLNNLQTMLQMVSQGESPSSSASDIDTLNHQGTVDKPALTKGSFPHIAGSLLVGARNRQNFVRLLDVTQDMNLAMEASTKSQNAFRAATVTLEEAQNRDCVLSVKRVVDFSFHDVEALIRLVEAAMDALSRLSFAGPKY